MGPLYGGESSYALILEVKSYICHRAWHSSGTTGLICFVFCTVLLCLLLLGFILFCILYFV